MRSNLTQFFGVKECSLAIGTLIGYDNIFSVSWLNSAVVVFVKTIEFNWWRC